MKSLRASVIRLAHEHPEFRNDLLGTLKTASSLTDTEYYDQTTGKFPKGGSLDFIITGDIQDLDRALEGLNGPEAKDRALEVLEMHPGGPDLESVWDNLEQKVIGEVQKIFGKPIQQKPRVLHGKNTLFCSVPMDSYQEFVTAWSKMKFLEEDTLRLSIPYFEVRDFTLSLGNNPHFSWNWWSTTPNEGFIGDFIDNYKPGQIKVAAPTYTLRLNPSFQPLLKMVSTKLKDPVAAAAFCVYLLDAKGAKDEATKVDKLLTREKADLKRIKVPVGMK